jgi:hypothetical protein
VDGARWRELTEEHVKQKGIEGETRIKKGAIDWVCLFAEAPESLGAANKMPPLASAGGPSADHPHT